MKFMLLLMLFSIQHSMLGICCLTIFRTFSEREISGCCLSWSGFSLSFSSRVNDIILYSGHQATYAFFGAAAIEFLHFIMTDRRYYLRCTTGASNAQLFYPGLSALSFGFKFCSEKNLPISAGRVQGRPGQEISLSSHGW